MLIPNRGAVPSRTGMPAAALWRVPGFYPGWGATRPGTRGQQIFFNTLAAFAAQVRNPCLTAIEQRFGAPLQVAVHGRRGVGRGAVAAALARAGVTTVADTDHARCADVDVLVIAEAVKAEDRAHLAACTASTSAAAMLVLNKADLTGAGRGGPLACAERRAAQFTAELGVAVVPMIGHLAAVELDDEAMAALRTLVGTPADMSSTDAFIRSDHPLPPELRRRLLESLDRFGLAHAVLAVADGATAATLVRQLRALSQVDRVVQRLDRVAAPVRYRRVREAVRELHRLAAQTGDSRLEAFLAGDEVVIAVMAAAVEMVEVSGLTVDRGDEATAHLRRALLWRRHARGPFDVLHQRCAQDITRGSLRLLGRAR